MESSQQRTRAGTNSVEGAGVTRRRFMAAGVGLLAAGCGRAPGGAGAEVVSTVGMVHDIVQHVGGGDVRSRALLGPGIDPHLYKPTRDDVAAMMRAEAVFYVGLMLEGKMGEVLEKMAARKLVHPVTRSLSAEQLLAADDEGGESDPHVWMDPLLWADCARGVAEALAGLRPELASAFRGRVQAYAARCQELHEYGRRVLSTVPENGRVLISSHDAFNYFGRAFGLRVMGVQGISTESEAGLQRINSLVDFIVRQGVRAVFVESSVSSRSIQALVAGVRSRGHSLQVGGELYSDAMGEAGTYEGTYFGMLDHNITVVARALGGEAPADGLGGRLSHAG